MFMWQEFGFASLTQSGHHPSLNSHEETINRGKVGQEEDSFVVLKQQQQVWAILLQIRV